jgi:hypothetical protein
MVIAKHQGQERNQDSDTTNGQGILSKICYGTLLGERNGGGKACPKRIETRNEAKDWLVERGVMLADAEDYLLKADGGRAVRVLLKKQFSV